MKYYAHNNHADNKIFPVPKSDGTNIFTPESHDVNPLIFYRVARPLKEEVKLPTLNLATYFEQSEYHGLKLSYFLTTHTRKIRISLNFDKINIIKQKHQ